MSSMRRSPAASGRSRSAAAKERVKSQMTNSSRALPDIRRLVTGHDTKAVAKVLIDGPAGNKKFPRPGSVATLIWCTDEMPADISVGENVEDMGARILGTAPPANGTRFTVNDIPPGNTPIMHRTETLDYVIVLSGEIDMESD